ncbi:hypothetical protein [Octadecabacter antarcticus]|uniref:hypothetical protein n=1 Tax=Octadecabacter antarcticus TaxID=1217908 RepID=UPI001181A20F|nr:hypothetical protein [Octadecabacter antarcticus]
MGEANGSKVRHIDDEASKLLRDARMAGLVQLRRGIGHIGEWQLWADSNNTTRRCRCFLRST